MKKLSILCLFAAFLMVFVSCKRTPGCTDPNSVNFNPDAKKDDGSCLVPEQVQNLFLFKLTGVNCGICGYSSDQLKDVLAQYSNVHQIYMHVGTGDPLNKFGSLKTIMPTSGGIPVHYLNASKAHYSEMEDSLPVHAATTPVGACVGSMTIEGNMLKVSTGVRFFQDVEGEYELGVYVVENNIPAVDDLDQSGTSDPAYEHDHTYRQSLNSNGIGDNLSVQDIRKDYTYFQEYEVEISQDWVAENLSVILVLWKASDNLTEYKFINVNEVAKQ